MTPEELSKFPIEALEGALTILESQEKLKKIERAIDLSKIPDDVLDMAIEIKEKELEEK